MEDDIKVALNQSHSNISKEIKVSSIKKNLLTDNIEQIPESIYKIKEIEGNIEFLSKEEMDHSKIKNNSLSRLKETINPILIPKENLNNFFTKLASVSRLNTINLNNTRPEKKGEEKYNKLILKMMKNKRETALLDEKLNIHEILQDKSHLLLTEDNIALENSLESSKDEYIGQIQKSITESNHVDLLNFDTFNQDSKELFNKRNDLSKMKLKCITQNPILQEDKNYTMKDNPNNTKFKKTKQTNSASTKVSTESTKKIKEINSKNTIPIDKKDPLKQNNLLTAGNITTKYNINPMKIKRKNISPINKFNASSSLKPISRDSIGNSNANVNTNGNNSVQKTNQSGIKKSNNLSISSNISTKITSKSPIVKINKTPIKQSNENRDSSIKKNRVAFIKNKNNISVNFSEAFSSVNSANSKKDILNSSILTNKKNGSIKSLNSIKKKASPSRYEYDARLTNDMNTIEEYEYSKILMELRAIFGDELQFFDENSKLNNV
jgi:hypothetical protein